MRSAGHPDIAVDFVGMPHIATPAQFGLRYVHKTGADWVIEDVDDSGIYPCLILIGGEPCIVYQHDPAGFADLRVAYREGGSWRYETIDAQGNYPCVIQDSINTIHVSYVKGDRLRYAYHDSSGWHSMDVDDAYGDTTIVTDPSEHGPYRICICGSSQVKTCQVGRSQLVL